MPDIDRRQFNLLLGASALAAPLGMLARADALAATPRHAVTTVSRLEYAVADYAKVRDFYRDLLGMRLRWDDGRQCLLEFGDLNAPNAMLVRTVAKGEQPNFNRVSFGMPHFAQALPALRRSLHTRGLLRPEGQRSGELRFVDPCGFALGLTSDRAPASPPLQPSHGALEAIAFSHMVLSVSDVAKDITFYTDTLGMTVVYYKPEENPQCMLRFGKNTLYLRLNDTSREQGLSSSFDYLRSHKGDENTPHGDHFAFVIRDYDSAKVKAELERRGYTPKQDSYLAWSITDPAGFRIEIADFGVPEYVSQVCHGSIAYNNVTHTGGCPATPPK